VLKNKKKIAISLITVLLAGGGFIMTKKASASDVVILNTTTVETRDVISNVYASGNVVVTESRNLSPEDKGLVTALYASVGDTVEKGQVLADVDSSELNKSLERKKINLSIENENLNQILLEGNSSQKSDLKKALIEFERVQSKFDSDKILFEAGSVSESSFNESKDALQREKLNLDNAQHSVENSTFDSRVKTQKLTIQLIEIEIEELNQKIAKRSIASPFDGILTEINFKANEMYDETKHLLKVQNMDSRVVKSLISEGEINKLKVGQVVKITANSIKGQTIDGTIRTISPSTVKKEGKTQAYTEIIVDFNEQPQGLKDGFLVNLTVEAQKAEGAMAVKFESVSRNIDGQNSVIKLLDDGGSVNIPVKLGVEGDVYVELISDKIKVGDELILETSGDMPSVLDELSEGLF